MAKHAKVSAHLIAEIAKLLAVGAARGRKSSAKKSVAKSPSQVTPKPTKKPRAPDTRNVGTEVKVGDVLYGTWGYNTTIAEFYQVTRVTDSVFAMPIEKRADPPLRVWQPSWTVMPMPGHARGKEIRLRPAGSPGMFRIASMAKYISKWNGKPVTETSD